MATYAIGDVQGCLQPLQCLLDEAKFNPDKDILWFAGDLVNRGPDSLKTLRFIHSLGERAVVVLGNHDIHLLAVAYGFTDARKKDTLKDILNAHDCHTLLEWLRRQKLVHISDDQQFILSHAGIPPMWSSDQALAYAAEIESLLQSDNIASYLPYIYGDQPDTWLESLAGPERWRLITNYFTRMRFCDTAGRLELSSKEGPEQAPPGFEAWYKLPNRLQPQQKVLFGHWAALSGNTNDPRFIALDTGCVWGGQLSMYRLEDGQWFRCNCQ